MRGIEPERPADHADHEDQEDLEDHGVQAGHEDPVDQAEGAEDQEPDQEPDEEPGEEMAPRRFDSWRRRSAVGGMATGIALGLQEVFYPSKNEPVISAEAPGEPPDADDRLRVILDPDDPTKSIVLLPKADRPPSDA
jgi:hypothetical protein